MFRLALAHGSRHAHASTTSVFPSPVGMGSTSGSPFRATSTCQRYGVKPVAVLKNLENWSGRETVAKLLIVHPFETPAAAHPGNERAWGSNGQGSAELCLDIRDGG